MPKLQVTVGLPASGKTSWAKGQLKKSKDTVAFSYDDFRLMLFNDVQNGGKGEELVRRLLFQGVREALSQGFNVIVHNTTLTDSAKQKWQTLTNEYNLYAAPAHKEYFNNRDKAKLTLEFVDFTKVSADTCIGRDNLRQGHERVSPPVIWNMALHAGLLKGYFDPNKKIVIVDVDGTLADHEGVRGPYDEHKVHLDKPYDVVVDWVRNLAHTEEKLHTINCPFFNWNAAWDTHPNDCDCPFNDVYQVVIVSGRSTVCALSTYLWLSSRITLSAAFMRNRGDRRPDVEVKQEILDALLQVVPKEQIAFVLDDRPKVINMWRANGLTVYPVRGAVDDF
jgi:hypothetical protein